MSDQIKKNITFDEALTKIPNKYVLTTVAGKRAREITKGDAPLTKSFKKDTIVKKALRDIYYDKISYQNVIDDETGE